MHRHPALLLIPSTLLSVALPTAAAAVADTTAGSAELDAALSRLVVAGADAPSVLFVDLDEERQRHVVELSETATLSSAFTADGRFLLAAHADAVTVVDGGAWTDGHGDHVHHYATEPRALGAVDGAAPSHLISHDGTTAMWFDGEGAAALFDEHDFADGRLEEIDRLTTAGPHHGFAVPFGDVFVTTAPGDVEGEMPDTVVVAEPDGTAVAEHECTQSHGETSWAHGVAVACREGVLVLNEDGSAWTGAFHAYPETDDVDPYEYGPARAWTLDTTAEGETIVAPFGSRHVLVLDPHTGDASTIDLGGEVALFGVAVDAESDRLVVLTSDGSLQSVDAATGEVSSTIDVLDPFTEGDPEEPYRFVVVTGDSAYISDPDANAVVEVSLGNDPAVVDRLELDFAPGFLGVVNG